MLTVLSGIGGALLGTYVGFCLARSMEKKLLRDQLLLEFVRAVNEVDAAWKAYSASTSNADAEVRDAAVNNLWTTRTLLAAYVNRQQQTRVNVAAQDLQDRARNASGQSYNPDTANAAPRLVAAIAGQGL